MAQEADVWAGVLAGVARFFRELELEQPQEIQNGQKQVQEAVDLALSVVKEQEDWHPRGTRLFAELLTIGVLSRWRFGEAQLNEEQIKKFAAELKLLENCWFHLKIP